MSNELCFVDYSQTKSWLRCPWEWYEKYINQLERRRPERYRDDALCLGTLVHNGLDNYAIRGKPEIDEATIVEVTPSPDCLALAYELVNGYVQRYPSEQWEIHKTEQPLTFPLPEAEPVVGLAKLDAYFYVPEQTTVESGLPGQTLDLAPGWWIREYKTKSAAVDRALWMMAWDINLQASFQMLALQEHVRDICVPYRQVRGVLVSVLEKPRRYIPRRKCKGCGEMFEMAAYLPAEDGASACPMCGTVQKLKAYEPKTIHQPEYYRLTITRDERQLANAMSEIIDIALAMDNMRHSSFGLHDTIPNREACVDTRWGACQYYENHAREIPTSEDQNMVKRDATKYVGLDQLMEVA